MKKQHHPTHSFRTRNKVWNEFKKNKKKSGKNWDRFIEDINKSLQVK